MVFVFLGVGVLVLVCIAADVTTDMYLGEIVTMTDSDSGIEHVISWSILFGEFRQIMKQ